MDTDNVPYMIFTAVLLPREVSQASDPLLKYMGNSMECCFRIQQEKLALASLMAVEEVDLRHSYICHFRGVRSSVQATCSVETTRAYRSHL